jgi:D-3-phosphoglycerate dehydrogenase
MAHRVLVSDDLAPEGIGILKGAPGFEVDVRVGLSPADLLKAIGGYEALAVRSATKVTREVLEAGKSLKVVGRAGIGVDNIDLGAATRLGIVVMNTPGGNTITVAEHTLAMLMAAARYIPQATQSMRAGQWEKKKFSGRELFNKTLGVVGLGNIGSVVAQRALALKMKVVAYDPFLSAEAAKRLGVEMATLDDLYRRADFITVHVPLTEQTRGLVGTRAIGLMKPTAILVNCARGGIVDETALVEALKTKKLAAAALDVFEKEPLPKDHPLLSLDNVVLTPHLGASTEEAQVNVAVALAEQMVDYLVNGTVRNAVNLPSVSREVLDVLGPYLNLGAKLGRLCGQLAASGTESIDIEYSGEITKHAVGPITSQVLRGMLAHFMDVPVNEVNAPALAQERGIAVSERRTSASPDFASLIAVTVKGASQSLRVAGTLFGRQNPRIVQVNQFDIEAVPEGHLLVLHNRDVPGVIGKFGTTLGSAGINIGRIHLSRAGGEAFSLVNIDSPAPSTVIDALRRIDGAISVTQVEL